MKEKINWIKGEWERVCVALLGWKPITNNAEIKNLWFLLERQQLINQLNFHSIQPNKKKNKFIFLICFHFISIYWLMKWKWIKKYYNSMDNTDHTGWKLEEMKNF